MLFFALILKKMLGRVPGVFWIVLFFPLILKKKWGVFRACSGRVVFASFLKKNLGRVLGVFSVFSVFQSLSNSPKKGKNKGCIHMIS